MMKRFSAWAAVALALGMALSASLATAAAMEEAASAIDSRYPVPRTEAFVVETDTNYANFDIANPRVPRGTQWGSGWHQLANEWDWYINYATGEEVMWRTTGWEYAADNMSLTWHVREGVTWNDGARFTGNDIVFTFQMLMDDPGLNGASHAENVAAVTATDDYTVEFSFKQPDYRFHHKMRMWGGPGIIAAHKWRGQNPREYKNWPPVETGPYVFHSLDRDNGMFIWERDDDYWARSVHGKFPGPKYGIFRIAPPPDIDLEEFIEGAVDMPLPHIFTIDMIRTAQRRSDHVVLAPFMDAVSQGISSFNTARFPTDDPEFRWAVQHLVNREKHARIYPMAEESFVTMWPWPDWGSLDRFESAELAAKYGPELRYDPEAAEQKLDAAGYQKGADGMRRGPNGEEILLTLITRPAPDIGFQHAQDFADELRKVGIDSNMRVVDPAVFGDLAANGDYDVAFDVLGVFASFVSDPWNMLDSFHSKHAKPIGEYQTSGDRSRSRLQAPAMDAITDTLAITNPGSDDYEELVAEGLDLWFQELPMVPAVEKMFVQTFSDRYWSGWPTADNMYHVPYQWWPEIIFVLFELEPAS